MSLAVSGGTATVTPPAVDLDRRPAVRQRRRSPPTTCTGAACSRRAAHRAARSTRSTPGRRRPGRRSSLRSLNAPAPPAGVCPGFASHTQGAEFDIRPLTTDATLPDGDPARPSLGNQAVVPDRRLPRHEPALHHRDPVALEPHARRRRSSPAERCPAAGGGCCRASRASSSSRAAASCSGRTSRVARGTRPATPCITFRVPFVPNSTRSDDGRQGRLTTRSSGAGEPR